MARQALVPEEQSLVPFYDEEILSVRLSDGRIAASHNALCKMAGLSPHGQLQRIRRDEILSEQLLLVIVETSRGFKQINVLTAWAIPTWLTGLNLNMVAPEKRPMILALRREAADVLYRHFFKIDADEKAASPPNPSAEAPRSPRKMTHKAFERLHEAADALHQVADELDESYMVAQERIEAMGDHIVALEAEVARNARRQTTVNPVPSDGPRLSKDHLYQAYALACDEHHRSGQRVDRLLGELAQTFGVEDMSDIPDASWEEVAAWFWERRQRR